MLGGLRFRMMIIVLSLLCVFGMVCGFPMSVDGQVVNAVLVQPPTAEDFPELSVQVKPPISFEFGDAQISQDQISVFENERQVEILALNRMHIGVHFTLAINGDSFFDFNDENGVSPYDRILEVLEGWASTRDFAEADSWSFITNEGTGIRNTGSGEVWRLSLIDYEPNFRNATPDLESLSSAIESARDRVVPFGVDKSILYITAPPMPEQIEAVNALTLEAQLAGIQVNVWMVGDAYYLSNEQGAVLTSLAENTGGRFFNYTGTEPLPDPESYLSSIGSFYTLTYETRIRETGTYPLRVTINSPAGEVSGESVPFYLEVEPPSPILLAPPETIERRMGQSTEENGQNLYPDLTDINILIEFPDGHPREIASSRLIVDGRVVQVKDQPPFDMFIWDISTLDESGEHRLQVEVRDNLGLTGRTIETPVQILVIEPEVVKQPLLNRPWVIALIVGLAIGVAFGIYWLARSAWFINQIKKFQKQFLKQSLLADQRKHQGAYPFYRGDVLLHPLALGASFDPDQRIPIEKSSVIIGSDPEKADIVFNKPGIAGMHAQVNYHQGRYWLKNLDATRGTWINYQLMNGESVQIKPGDIIHVGDVGFRFTIINADQAPEVTVSKFKPNR